jgi:hypothetical protein
VTVFALRVRLSQGEYLGKTVQVVPHITNAIGDWIERGDVHDPVCGWTMDLVERMVKNRRGWNGLNGLGDCMMIDLGLQW